MTKPTRVKSAFSAIKTGEDGDSYIYTITFTGKLTKVQADSASPSVAEAISKWCQRKFPHAKAKSSSTCADLSGNRALTSLKRTDDNPMGQWPGV